VDAKAVGHQEKEIVADQAGVGQLGDYEVVVDEPVGKCADQGGFTGSDIAGQQLQTLVLLDTVLQRRQRLPILPAEPQKAGIGVELKRLFPQFEMGQIHGFTPASRFVAGNPNRGGDSWQMPEAEKRGFPLALSCAFRS